MAGKNLISLLDFTPEQVKRLLEIAAEVKANPDRFSGALQGRTLFMYFEKPSLRTRVTFEAGMTQLGGHAIYYTAKEGEIGVRESVEDVARNLERWVDAAMCRTFSHKLIEDLGRHAEIPVINGLSDLLHPCQGLADFMTLAEVKRDLEGRKLVYVGDGNNVAHSLLETGAQVGAEVQIVTPEGHQPDSGVVERCRRAAERTGAPDPRVVSIMTRSKAGTAWVKYWNSLLYDGVLPHPLKEMCRILISMSHRCGYCSTVRSKVASPLLRLSLNSFCFFNCIST